MSKGESWVKVHTGDLNDARHLRLSWAQRGILDATWRYSKAHSTVPGFFVRDDKPMTIDDIALGIGARGAAETKLIADAFAAFIEHGLLNFTPAGGYDVANWDTLQSGTATEGRDAWRRRQANKRARDRDEKKRAAAAAARAAAGGSKIIDIRDARSPDDLL
jgi:hypothetical protein